MQMLYQSGALISGSAALKLVSGKLFRPSDIDFVVTAAHADIVFAFLFLKGYQPNFRSDTYLGCYAPASFVVRRFARVDCSVDVTVPPVIIYCRIAVRLCAFADSFWCRPLQLPSISFICSDEYRGLEEHYCPLSRVHVQ